MLASCLQADAPNAVSVSTSLRELAKAPVSLLDVKGTKPRAALSLLKRRLQEDPVRGTSACALRCSLRPNSVLGL